MCFSLKIVFTSFLVIMQSCKSTNSAVTSNENNTNTKQETSMTQEDLQGEGYSLGMVKTVEGSECPFIIINEKTGAQFDPINWDDDKFKSFRKADSKIYFKFLPLRMRNRCAEAQPVSLVDIKKRED